MTLFVNTAGVAASSLSAFAGGGSSVAPSVQASAIMAPMTATILQHLRRIGDISAAEANSIYRCRSVSKRMSELKDLGFGIESDFRKDATGQRYVRYVLRDDRKNVVL